MRCDEVIRELAAPTDDRDGTALADHLAGCPSCSEWARQAAQLDQLWDATRPPEPSPEAWGSVWANIARSLPSAAADGESARAATVRPSRNGTASRIVTHPAPLTAVVNPPRTRRFGAIVWMGLAQAAAILVAIGLALAWHGSSSGPAPQNIEVVNHPAAAAPSPVRVSEPVRVDAEIEEGREVVIVADGSAPRVLDKTPPETAYGVDAMYVMFNVVESIANPRIASR
jgi:hypothetical protein